MGNISVYDSCSFYDLKFREPNVLQGFCEKNNTWGCARCEERQWNFRDVKVLTTNLKRMSLKDAIELEKILRKYNIKYQTKDYTDIFGRNF